MIASCNCVSGGSGVCILCLFMPFAKVSLVEGLGSLVWVTERWRNVRTNVHEQRAGRSDSKAAFGFRDKICSNFSFGFQVVRVLRRSDSGVTSVIDYLKWHKDIKSLLFLTKDKYFFEGHPVVQMVEALRYKPEGREFDTRWGHWNFFVYLTLPAARTMRPGGG